MVRLIFTLLALSGMLGLYGQETAAAPESASGAPSPVEAFVNGGSVDPSSVAILVMDLRSGEVLAEHNAGKPLVPASVMKCVTTASLLGETGEKWRYETRVEATGPVRGNVLEGDIRVVAAADPSLNTRHEPGSEDIVAEIVDALRRLKVDTVRGHIVVDESAFAGPAVNPSWASADLPHAYGTGTHGFNFEDNASGKSSVKDPVATFRSRLRGAMARNGMALLDEDVPQRHAKVSLLGTHRSEEIQEIMRSCMMRSDNQFAEGMLRTFSSLRGLDGSVEKGAKAEENYWKHKKLPLSGVNIVDGSGLSRSNRLTADFLGGVLRAMAVNPYYASFFPLAGQEGTLKRFLAGSPLEGYVAMKTGSMNGIQSYAGYKIDEDYVPTHVIVVMMNNLRDRARARADLSRMLERIFSDVK